MTTARLPLAGEHQVAGLDVAVDHAVLVGVLQAQGRLVDEVAGVGHRQRPAGLDQLRQVEALDVLHGQDEALAEAEGRVGGDDVGVVELGRGADLAEEAVEHAAAVDEVAADDLEHLLAAHERVLGQVDDAHAAAAQLAEDLVIGVVGQSRGQRAGRRRCRGRRAAGQHRQAGERGDDRGGGIGPALGVAEPAEEAVGGDRGDAVPAVRALLQVLVDRFGRGVVELAQAVGTQGLVGRVGSWRGVHGIGLPLRARVSVVGSMAQSTERKAATAPDLTRKMQNSWELPGFRA